jgi:hypothetical protein
MNQGEGNLKESRRGEPEGIEVREPEGIKVREPEGIKETKTVCVCSLQMSDILEARGVNHVPSDAAITRFIAYCAEHFGDKEVGGKLIQRSPRTQDQARAGVQPVQIARYFFKLERLLKDKKPRAVRPRQATTDRQTDLARPQLGRGNTLVLCHDTLVYES